MSHNVLLVDDEPSVLSALERLLRRDGHTLHLAESGPAAVELLDAHTMAAILCDQRMPGMSGAEVLAEAYRRQPDAVRITLTGYTDLSAAVTTINEAHISFFLLKPWDDEHLRTVVRDAVHTFELTCENRRLSDLTQRQKEELERWNEQLEEQVAERTAELSARHTELQMLHDRLDRSLRDTVAVLAGLLETNNPNLGLHSKRVAEAARQLGAELGLNEHELRDLEFAARLHDIGKTARRHQANALLGRTAREREQAHGHSESGYAILAHVGGFEAIARAVLHHAEHYDGTGFPDQLQGDAIPLAARIIAVVNAYDKAAFSDSSTHVSAEAGRRVLRADRAKLFDPDLVQVFLACLAQTAGTDDERLEIELPPRQIAPGMVLSRDLRNIDGLLVLKAGITLTAAQVERIGGLSDLDPLLDGVFVRCTPNDDASAAPPAAAESETPAAAPKPEVPAAAPRATAAPPPVNTPTRRHRALLIDDEPSVRSALARELRRAGWETISVENGRMAQNLLEAETFDLLLVDVAMPIMSGDLLVAHVQQCWPDLPCVVLTGHATREQLTRLVRLPNVVEILAKPWDHDRLLAAIDSAMARRAAAPTGEAP